jgi:hypothetical protein
MANIIPVKLLKYLKNTLKESLGSDDYTDVLFYFDELKKYQKGFNILMEYFDSIADEEKPKVNKRLKRLGL